VGLQSLPWWQMSEWISVKDRLPKEGRLVLINRIYHPLSLDYLIDFPSSPSIWARLRDDEMCQVTHWMELPEPPK
jgi:hypothetical protein